METVNQSISSQMDETIRNCDSALNVFPENREAMLETAGFLYIRAAQAKIFGSKFLPESEPGIRLKRLVERCEKRARHFENLLGSTCFRVNSPRPIFCATHERVVEHAIHHLVSRLKGRVGDAYMDGRLEHWIEELAHVQVGRHRVVWIRSSPYTVGLRAGQSDHVEVTVERMW